MNEEELRNLPEAIVQKRINNYAEINGIVVQVPEEMANVRGEKILELKVKVGRKSNAFDIIPVSISERTLKDTRLSIGDEVNFTGEFRSYNKIVDEKSHLCLNLFARNFKILDKKGPKEEPNDLNFNKIALLGHICKEPKYRETPLGRKICDILLAVNRTNAEKSDYIPLIIWGRNAEFAADLNIGDKILIEGRMQSRVYEKDMNGEMVTKMAYEVSASSIYLLERENTNKKESPSSDKVTAE